MKDVYNYMKFLNRLIFVFVQYVHNLSIKVKLLFCFFIFSLIITSILGIVFYSKTSNVINQQSSIYSDTVLAQVIKRIEKLTDEILEGSIPVITDLDIQKNDFDTLNKEVTGISAQDYRREYE